MSRETVENLISQIPDEYMETLYNFVVKLVPGVELDEETLKAHDAGWKDIQENGSIRHEDIDWK